MALRTATAADLAVTLADLRPGDTLRLVGDFPAQLRPKGERLTHVTIDAAKARVPAGLYPVGRTDGIRVIGGAWGPLRLDGATDLGIEGVRLDGDGVTKAQGVFVNGGAGVSMADSCAHGFRTGVALAGVEGFDLLRLGMSRMTSDGLQLSRCSHGLVEDLTVDGTAPTAPGVHPDGVQIVGAPGYVCEDLTFRRIVLRGLYMQGFFADDGPVRRLTLERATIQVGAPRALSISDGCDVTIRDVDVSTYPGAATQARAHLANCSPLIAERVNVAPYGRHVAQAVVGQG